MPELLPCKLAFTVSGKKDTATKVRHPSNGLKRIQSICCSFAAKDKTVLSLDISLREQSATSSSNVCAKILLINIWPHFPVWIERFSLNIFT